MCSFVETNHSVDCGDPDMIERIAAETGDGFVEHRGDWPLFYFAGSFVDATYSAIRNKPYKGFLKKNILQSELWSDLFFCRFAKFAGFVIIMDQSFIQICEPDIAEKIFRCSGHQKWFCGFKLI